MMKLILLKFSSNRDILLYLWFWLCIWVGPEMKINFSSNFPFGTVAFNYGRWHSITNILVLVTFNLYLNLSLEMNLLLFFVDFRGYTIRNGTRSFSSACRLFWWRFIWCTWFSTDESKAKCRRCISGCLLIVDKSHQSLYFGETNI